MADPSNPGGGPADTTVEAVAAPVKTLTKVMQGLRKATDALIKPFEEVTAATSGLVAAFGGEGARFKGFMESATAIDTMRASLEQLTGQGAKYTKMAVGLQSSLRGLGIANFEAQESVATLVEGFAEFTLMAPKAQEEIAKQTAAMTRLGISLADATANWDLMIKVMGMSQNEAKKTTNDIAKLALAIGVPPKQMAKDFAAAMPHLSRYGKAGIKVFNELAVQSKATGVSMSALLKVAEGFDTFEQAATKAGSLNAMLGGNLINSIDMLTASESERIDMIRQGIMASGQSWEMMDRFQRKGIAAAAGIGSMSDAMKLFGTEQVALEDLKNKADPAIVAQQNLTKAMRDGTTMLQKFMAAFESLGNVIGSTIMPILQRMATFFTGKDGLGAVYHIFKKIASGIEGMFNWWVKLHPETKELIKNFATMVIKVMALSFAIQQAKEIAAPFFQMFSSPWLLIIGGIVAVITHWNQLDVLWKKITTTFKKLDGIVMRFFDRHKDNKFIQGLKAVYDYLKNKIPPLLTQLGDWFTNNKAKIKDFMDTFVAGPFSKLWDQFQTSTGIFQGGVSGLFGRMVDGVKNFLLYIKEGWMKMAAVFYTLMSGLSTGVTGQLTGLSKHSVMLRQKAEDYEIAAEGRGLSGMEARQLGALRLKVDRAKKWAAIHRARGQGRHGGGFGEQKRQAHAMKIQQMAEAKLKAFETAHPGASGRTQVEFFGPGQTAAGWWAEATARKPGTAPTVPPPTSAAVAGAKPEAQITTNINLCLEADGMKKEIGQIAINAVEERMNPNNTQRLSIPPLMSIWTPTPT